MAATNDTIDGLLAEFRGYSAGMPASYHVTMSWADFRVMLDRFDAANKREVQNALDAGGFVEASRKNKQVGNAAKLREALSKFCAYSAEVLNTGMFNRVHLEELLNMAKAAIAAPARNCDALTADERTHKFIEKWEKAHGESIDGKTIIYLSSFSRWLQLPCERTEKEGVHNAD